jgi:multisubunit Na+/H+ antiporter MnhE subunit
MPMNLIILIGTLIVAFIIFKTLFSIGKSIIGAAVTVFAVIMILSYFGFSPQEMFAEITKILSGGK